MQKQWRRKKQEHGIKQLARKVHIAFFFAIIIGYTIFGFYAKVTEMIFSEKKVDIFTEDLPQIALYFSSIDTDVSDFLIDIDTISQDYVAGENIFETQSGTLENTFAYLRKNTPYLKDIGFESYSTFLEFTTEILSYQETLYDLFGKNETQNYLVVLQNTSEKRPNGGFFGSFAFMSIKDGFIQELEIIDSYLPDYHHPDIRVEAPQWSSAFLLDNKIGFIAGNKFGFTRSDGNNIQALYEQMYNRPIRGVIFITSDIVSELLPGMQEQLWEWQFVNASVDIIRGENRSNKKEQYIDEVNELFASKKYQMMAAFINNFEKMQESHAFQVYLENIPKGLEDYLTEQDFTNGFNENNIYLWDQNDSYNKADWFVEKTVYINSGNQTLINTFNKDIIDISTLTPGTYDLQIDYSIHVSDYYSGFIASLENKYNIEITDREKGILVLQPTYNYVKDLTHLWASRSIVYMNPSFTITGIQGDTQDYKKFTTPFAQGAFYYTHLPQNNDHTSITITFTIPEEITDEGKN